MAIKSVGWLASADEAYSENGIVINGTPQWYHFFHTTRAEYIKKCLLRVIKDLHIFTHRREREHTSTALMRVFSLTSCDEASS